MQTQWTDLDALQHVNHAKYAGWILEVELLLACFSLIYMKRFYTTTLMLLMILLFTVI